MNVYGVEIEKFTIHQALAKLDMEAGFTAGDLETELCRLGVPYEEYVAHRCADRTLQDLSKRRRINYDGRLWKAVDK